VTILPPVEQSHQLIVRLASLYQRLGHELGTRPLVLPDGKFFPDAFTGDEKSVKRLARRMKTHAGMDDIPTKVRVVGTDDAATASGCCGGACTPTAAAPAKSHGCSGGCSDGGCGKCESGGCGKCEDGGCDCSSHDEHAEPEGPAPRLVDLGDEWLIQVPATELRSDIVLTTNLAKVLGLIFLLENLPKGAELEQPVEATIEIASVALGFGALLLEGSYLYSKSCGGPKVGRATTLDCGSVALLTAFFIARGKLKANGLRRHLSTTQAAAFSEAEALVSTNRSLVEKLAAAPGQLTSGDFAIRTELSFWDRVFGSKRTPNVDLSTASDLNLDELEAMVAAQATTTRRREPRPNDTKHEDLRALVDDALAESATEAEAS
jgi:hypothetical protein